MTQDDRMETITDPEQIRATDEPDPFRRNPVAQTGPDDPWRFTRFVADDHECVIVRDEYDEPAPFGSCATHRRALSSPVALGCATPAPVGAAVALDLDALHETICDKFTGMAEVRQAADLLVAEVRSLRANWRMVTTALGYGDGITEPQIEHRDFVAECERQFAEASEWRESQRWRDECHEAGHPDDEDCYEHDPVLALVALRAKVAAVEALAVEWEALRDRLRAQNPVRKTGSSGLHRREANTLDVVAEQIRAALATGEGQHVAREVFTAEGIPFVRCSCTNAKSPTSSRWLAEHVPNGGVAELQAVVKRQDEGAKA